MIPERLVFLLVIGFIEYFAVALWTNRAFKDEIRMGAIPGAGLTYRPVFTEPRKVSSD